MAGLLIAIVGGGIHVVNSYVNTKLELRIIGDFRGDLFRHTERLSVAFRDQVSTGRLMYAINFEAAAAGSLILSIQPLVQAGLTLVGWFGSRSDRQCPPYSRLPSCRSCWSIHYCATHISAAVAGQ
jgi:ATP-binding cassette subfamily B protein/subfamily B ATP-binding cassette protein MsbA